MVISAYSNTHDRHPDMDFAALPFYIETNIIMYKKPNPDDESITLFLRVSISLLLITNYV